MRVSCMMIFRVSVLVVTKQRCEFILCSVACVTLLALIVWKPFSSPFATGVRDIHKQNKIALNEFCVLGLTQAGILRRRRN